MGELSRRDTPAVRPVRELPLVERHTVSDSWAVNTYAACDIRCTYCITSAQGRSVPRVPPEVLAQRLRDELDAVGEIDRLVVGPYCDVYPGPERELGVTRRALEVLVARGHGFNVVTKGTTVVRDADLFRHPGTLIQISLNTLDDRAVARLEPGAPSAEERLRALHVLAEEGVRVLVQATPWIPGVTDVAALRARVDPAIWLQVTPLRLPPHLDRATRALGLTQAGVNEAFQREYERVAPLRRVRWSRPPALDGSPPHITDNLGRAKRTDWTPAPAAPDPGPLRPWMRPDR
jgi:DNA repair photolyase